MSGFITPRISELVSKTDDELRELLSGLNNASLRKISRELTHEVTDHRLYILEQRRTIGKLRDRLRNVSKLASKEVE